MLFQHLDAAIPATHKSNSLFHLEFGARKLEPLTTWGRGNNCEGNLDPPGCFHITPARPPSPSFLTSHLPPGLMSTEVLE